MKTKLHHFDVTFVRLISKVLIFGLVFTAGCATGPTPEELARMERLRAERQASVEAQRREAEERQRQQAEKHRVLLSLQNEVQNNSADIRPADDSIMRAHELVAALNAAAGKSLQANSGQLFEISEIKEFLLDTSTGKLTLQLTPTGTRSLMLRHVKEVRTMAHTSSWMISDYPEIKNTYYSVVVDMGEEQDKLIYVSSQGNNSSSWVHYMSVQTNDEATANTIETTLKSLVSIYKS